MIGCTSSGELTEAGYDEDLISLIGFPSDEFHMVSHLFDDLTQFDAGSARAAVRDLVARAELGSANLRRKGGGPSMPRSTTPRCSSSTGCRTARNCWR
jgi:hypothetical protein